MVYVEIYFIKCLPEYLTKEQSERVLDTNRNMKRLVYCRYGQYRFLSDKGPTLETLDFALRIGSTPTFSYFDRYK